MDRECLGENYKKRCIIEIPKEKGHSADKIVARILRIPFGNPVIVRRILRNSSRNEEFRSQTPNTFQWKPHYTLYPKSKRLEKQNKKTDTKHQPRNKNKHIDKKC